jgi:hypothetical protein
VKTFTYGISEKQHDSFEVLTAAEVAKKLNVDWNWIKLDRMNDHLDDFYDLFGPSTHAHGMYHHDFYSKIRLTGCKANGLISGLIGDAWAGNVNIPAITRPEELNQLGYNHGMKADPEYLVNYRSSNDCYEAFWEREKEKLTDSKWRVVTAMRTKMILLKYLLKVPASKGFIPYAPFIEENLAFAMLNLSDTDKLNRKWQRDFLNSKNLLTIPIKLNNTENTLNTQGLKTSPVKPLDVKLLREIFDETYINWINDHLLSNFSSQVHERAAYYVSKFKLDNRIKIKDHHLRAYHAYLTVYPLQKIMQTRNKALGL